MFTNLSSGYDGDNSSSFLFGKKTPKNLRRRQLSQTPGSVMRTPGNNRSMNRYVIAAVWEGRGTEKGHIGLAWSEPENAEWVMMEFLDSVSYTRLTAELQLAHPSEILLPDCMNERTANVMIMEAIKGALPEVVLTGVQRRFFNFERSLYLIKSLSNIADFLKTIETRTFCTTAMGALIKFIEYKNEMNFHMRTIPFKYKDVTKSCMLDVSSWKNLEITNDNAPRKEKSSLLGVLDNTMTPAGYRLLRTSLMQPLTDLNAINDRLDAVEELIDNSIMLEQLTPLLNRVHDLDGIVNVCCRNIPDHIAEKPAVIENSLIQLLWLLQTLKVVVPLQRLLQGANSRLLVLHRERLENPELKEIYEILDTILDENTLYAKKSSIVFKQQKLYAIKEGINPHIGAARELYEEWLTKVENCNSEIYEHIPNENTRVAFSVSRGFHYVWTHSHPNTCRVPDMFFNVVRHRACLTFTSKKLVKFNEHIATAEKEILLACSDVLKELLEEMRPRIGPLYTFMDDIANLDMLMSLALYASNTPTTRPYFGDDIVIMQGRHPMLDMCLAPEALVTNDTYLTRDSRFAVITGPNMAGKSTLLKQICQLSLLAQTGSFVPAQMLKVPIFKKMFSRVGHNDSLTNNLSAFALEMKEMAMILNYSDKDTLIVIDELARSTSTEEGIGISYAISEDLLRKESFVLLSTHYLDLAALDVTYSAVENFHFKVGTSNDGESGCEKVKHKLFKGPYKGPLYGFDLIRIANFPTDLIETAEKLAYKLREETEKKRAMDGNILARRAHLRVAHRLRSSFELLKNASKQAQRAYLMNLRGSFMTAMAECEGSDEEEEQELIQNEFEEYCESDFTTDQTKHSQKKSWMDDVDGEEPKNQNNEDKNDIFMEEDNEDEQNHSHLRSPALHKTIAVEPVTGHDEFQKSNGYPEYDSFERAQIDVDVDMQNVTQNFYDIFDDITPKRRRVDGRKSSKFPRTPRELSPNVIPATP